MAGMTTTMLLTTMEFGPKSQHEQQPVQHQHATRAAAAVMTPTQEQQAEAATKISTKMTNRATATVVDKPKADYTEATGQVIDMDFNLRRSPIHDPTINPRTGQPHLASYAARHGVRQQPDNQGLIDEGRE